MAVNFYLEKRTDKNGDAPIRVSISVLGARVLTSTGLKIAPDKWEAGKQKAKRATTTATGVTASTINAELARIVECFTRFENECITAHHRPTKDELMTRFADCFNYNGRAGNGLAMGRGSILEYIDIFILESSKLRQWRTSTANRFRTLKSHLQKFDSALTFDRLNEARLMAFYSYLLGCVRLRDESLHVDIRLLKQFLKWAEKKGYNRQTAYKDFNPVRRKAAKKVHFLTWDELMRVYKMEIPEKGEVLTLHDHTGREYTKKINHAGTMECARDILCFCAFTSLRYSDAVNLKWADIGAESFTITTIKTGETITIDLNKYAREILERYAEFPEPDGHVFHNPSNSRANKNIKDICEICEINEPTTVVYYRGAERIEETKPKYRYITTHSGRRTFICNALELGIPPQVVMKWTGHKNYNAMRPYIDISSRAKAVQMAKFDDL